VAQSRTGRQRPQPGLGIGGERLAHHHDAFTIPEGRHQELQLGRADHPVQHGEAGPALQATERRLVHPLDPELGRHGLREPAVRRPLRQEHVARLWIEVEHRRADLHVPEAAATFPLHRLGDAAGVFPGDHLVQPRSGEASDGVRFPL